MPFSTLPVPLKALSAIGAALLLLAACGSGGGIRPQEVDGTTLLVAPQTKEPAGLSQAQFDGEVIRDDSGCIAGIKDGDPFGLVFPHGTELDSNGTEIILPSGHSVTIGSRSNFSGGYHSANRLDISSGVRCAFKEYFVVNES